MSNASAEGFHTLVSSFTPREVKKYCLENDRIHLEFRAILKFPFKILHVFLYIKQWETLVCTDGK